MKIITITRVILLVAFLIPAVLLLPQPVMAADNDPAAATALTKLDDILARLANYDYGRDATAVNDLSAWMRARPAANELNPQAQDRLIAFIISNASTAAKRYACEQLSVIGTEKCVPALALMLTNTDTSDIARYALERIPGPAADAVLRDALKQTSGKTGVGIINTLAVRRTEAALPMLETLATTSSDSLMVDAAIRAIGRIGTPACEKILVEKLWQNSQPGPVQQTFLQACLDCADRLIKDCQPEPALELYRKIYVPENPVQIRIAALIGLIRNDKDKSTELILAAMRDPESDIGDAAIAQLADMPGQQIDQIIADWLPSVPNHCQTLLLTVLAQRHNPAVMPAIKRMVENPDPAVKTAALEALGALGDASCVSLLAKQAATAAGQAPEAARHSLDRLAGPDIDETILTAVEQTTEPAEKIELIRCAARRGIPQAAQKLLITARHENKNVRIESLRALRSLAGVAEVEPLIDLALQSPDRSEEKEAAKTLMTAIRTLSPIESQADAVLNRLAAIQDARQQIVLMNVLGSLGNAKSLPVLQKYTQAPDTAVRDTAVRTLAAWPTVDAADILLQIVQQSPNQNHQILALRGYIRLAGLINNQPQQALPMYQNAIAAAKRADEQRQIIAGLANLATADALTLLIKDLNEPLLRNEAVTAILSVCEKITDTHPEQVKAALDSLLDVTQDPAIVSRADELLEFNYIESWEIAGPYQQTGMTASQLFDTVLPPEQIDGPKITWALLPDQTDSKRFWFVNLHQAIPAEQSAVYVRTWVWLTDDYDLTLKLGCDGGYKVWLNGDLYGQHNNPAPCAPGQYSVDLRTRKGWNELRIKLTHDTGPWGFSARLHHTRNRKIEGMRIQARPEKNIDPN